MHRCVCCAKRDDEREKKRTSMMASPSAWAVIEGIGRSVM